MRAIALEDCRYLSQLHGESFPKGWDTPQFEELLKSGASGWLLEGVGFILIRIAADEAEIITLAIDKTKRRQGYAGQLLQQLLSSHQGKIFLEVRENNEAAIRLYQKQGFSHIGYRPNYYALPDGSRVGARVMGVENLTSPTGRGRRA